MLKTNQAQSNMVQQQIRPWEVLDKNLLEIIASLPREHFVPAAYQQVAFADTEIPLGFGQVMLPPALIGRILYELNIQSNEVVLEVGTGSGYLTALTAKLCRTVTSVEIHKNLAQQASTRLSDLQINNVEILAGNALEILKSTKSFDVVIITGSTSSIPEQLIKQTKLGGRLFATVGSKPAMEACIFTRINEETWSIRKLFETVIPPLEGIEDAPTFEF